MISFKLMAQSACVSVTPPVCTRWTPFGCYPLMWATSVYKRVQVCSFVFGCLQWVRRDSDLHLFIHMCCVRVHLPFSLSLSLWVVLIICVSLIRPGNGGQVSSPALDNLCFEHIVGGGRRLKGEKDGMWNFTVMKGCVVWVFSNVRWLKN